LKHGRKKTQPLGGKRSTTTGSIGKKPEGIKKGCPKQMADLKVSLYVGARLLAGVGKCSREPIAKALGVIEGEGTREKKSHLENDSVSIGGVQRVAAGRIGKRKRGDASRECLVGGGVGMGAERKRV